MALQTLGQVKNKGEKKSPVGLGKSLKHSPSERTTRRKEEDKSQFLRDDLMGVVFRLIPSKGREKDTKKLVAS